MSQSPHYSPASLNHAYAAPEIVHQRQRTIENLALSANQKVLDIGCGTGFLTYEIANQVGENGSVYAIDKEPDMVRATKERCEGMQHVNATEGDVTALAFAENRFDAATCTQVLLYVAEIQLAIAEIVRVLKPGGTLAILETDWRTTVMRSSYPAITDKIYRAWDDTVASPNLPAQLNKLLTDAGLIDIYIEAIPLINTEFDPGNFSVSSLNWLSANAYKQGAISKRDSANWRADLESLGQNGAYFFCVNRFLFIAKKPQT